MGAEYRLYKNGELLGKYIPATLDEEISRYLFAVTNPFTGTREIRVKGDLEIEILEDDQVKSRIPVETWLQRQGIKISS